MNEGRLLGPDDIDRLGRALMTLSQELWVLKDRQRVLEALLEDAGVLDRAELEAFQPDDALDNELREARRALIDSVLGALREPSGDDAER